MLGIENEIRNSMPQRLHSDKCRESTLLGDFTYSGRLGRIPSGSATEGELRCGGNSIPGPGHSLYKDPMMARPYTQGTERTGCLSSLGTPGRGHWKLLFVWSTLTKTDFDEKTSWGYFLRLWTLSPWFSIGCNLGTFGDVCRRFRLSPLGEGDTGI